MEFITFKKSIIAFIVYVFFSITSYSQNTSSSEIFSRDYPVFLSELKEVFNSNCDRVRLEEELGDILFTCVNIARHINIDPEAALHKANKKFTQRFQRVEALLKEEMNIKPENADFTELEKRWTQAKKIK